MTANIASRSLAGFVVGAVATWLLGLLTSTLLLPFAAAVGLAVLSWRRGLREVAVSVAVGSATVTLLLAWLFATLGNGLATM